MIYESNYLMHHGIKGQKWGVENGPPYPLNPSKDYSRLEKRLNRKVNNLDKFAKRVEKSSKRYKKHSNFLTLRQQFDDETWFDSYQIFINKQLDIIRKKFNEDKDVNKLLNNTEKSINKIVDRIGDVRLTDDLKRKARKQVRLFADTQDKITYNIVSKTKLGKDIDMDTVRKVNDYHAISNFN